MLRLAQTLQLVRNIEWIVVEDGANKVPGVQRLLERSEVPYKYLTAPTRPEHKSKEKFSPAVRAKILVLVSIYKRLAY